MSSIVNQATVSALTAASPDALTATLGLVAVVLLLALLALKELFRARDPGAARTADRMRAFDAAIVPLLAVFLVVMLTRVVDLLNLD